MNPWSGMPHGEALRNAVRWLAQQPSRDGATIQEAALRFDLSPLEAEFLLRHFATSADRLNSRR